MFGCQPVEEEKKRTINKRLFLVSRKEKKKKGPIMVRTWVGRPAKVRFFVLHRQKRNSKTGGNQKKRLHEENLLDRPKRE